MLIKEQPIIYQQGEVMDWQDQLIKLYSDICQLYQEDHWVYGEGMSPNSIPHFLDEEVIKVEERTVGLSR